jgi:hypothetical protein
VLSEVTWSSAHLMPDALFGCSLPVR